MTRKSSLRSGALLLTLTLLFLLTQPAVAQLGGTGTIQGVITDPSGAVVPGATVTATNIATGVKTVRQSTATGAYLISPLPPGTYAVTVSASGFQTLVQEGVVVDALSNVGLNLTLQVGTSTESVTVSAAPPELNTQDARLGQTMRNEMYTALPLSMSGAPRNPQAFAFLLPGVQEGGRWGYFGGGQSFSKDVYIEGLPLTDAVQQGEGRALTLGVSVEAVDQFQVETNTMSVEFQGQGAENYILKSGTNEIHGSAYNYFRNTLLDARGFFAPRRSAEHQNQFGFTIGGPVIRNRLFYFGSYDGYRYRVETDYTFASVPTMKMRNGDFSELPVAIYDPASTVCPGGTNCSRTPFPGNVIPSSKISEASKLFQSQLPQPTHPGIVSNYLANLPVGFDNDNTNIKVDANATDNHRFSILFARGRRTQSTPYRGSPAPLPLPYTVTRIVDEVPTTGQIKHTWVMSPTMINQISFNASRLFVPITNPTVEGKWVEKAGIKGLPPGDARNSFPEVSFAGTNSPTGWRGTDARPFLDALNNFTLQESLQWLRGNHSFKFGFQHQRLQDNFRDRMDGTIFIAAFSNNQTAGFSPTGTLLTSTGNSYASYLMGTLNSATVVEDFVVTSGARFRNYALWAQDDWKVTRRLTLNLGLRWDLMRPYVEAVDRMSFMNPDLPNPAVSGRKGALQFAGKGSSPLYCNCRTPVETHWKNFGPRLGLAFQLTSNTVIRAGYGITYSRHGAVGGRGGARDGTGKLGYTAQPGFPSPNGFDPAFDWDDGVPPYEKPPFIDMTLNTGFYVGKSTGGSVTYANPKDGGRPPRYQNWNFSIQRSLSDSTVLTLAYAGSNGKLLRDSGGTGYWSMQIHPRYLALGNLLTAQATPANVAAARAIIPDVDWPYPNYTGTIAQMLKAFPQYSGIGNPYMNVGNSHYNSLQVTLRRRMSAGLTFNVNYTWSKTLTDAGAGRSAYFWQIEKREVNVPHVFNASFVYALPFGKGTSLPSSNAVVNALISDWRLSGITRIRAGEPYGQIGATCNLPSAGGCNASYNPNFTGSVRINGDWGSGNLLGSNPPVFLDKNAFMNPAPYTYGNTPQAAAYNLRLPANWGQDLSIMRQFPLPIRENVRLAFQADAFNLFNNVIFSGPASLNINNANFGRVTSQSNTPRVFQLSLKLTF